MSDYPPLHGQVFGGEMKGTRWAGQFDFLPDGPSWAFMYLDEYDNPVLQLTGYGSNPLSAFNDCVQKFINLNNGEESPVLKVILPQLMNYFNEDGGVKLEHFLT